MRVVFGAFFPVSANVALVVFSPVDGGGAGVCADDFFPGAAERRTRWGTCRLRAVVVQPFATAAFFRLVRVPPLLCAPIAGRPESAASSWLSTRTRGESIFQERKSIAQPLREALCRRA
eukprot:1016794-Prorocentrum_minimum.AAC.3